MTAVWKLSCMVIRRGKGSNSFSLVDYTSQDFRAYVERIGIVQSMSFARMSCYGNAKCESMWARMKEEAIYGRHKTTQMSMEDVKSLVFRYYMGYWNTIG